MKYGYFLVLLILIFSSKIFAIDVASKQFDELNIFFPGYEKGGMTLPVVLIYDLDGVLTHSYFGKDIHKIDSYRNLQHKKKQIKVSTPNVSETLTILKIKN